MTPEQMTNADRLIKSARAAAERMTGETSGAFYWPAMAGALEAHVRALADSLAKFEAPKATGSVLETMYAHDGGEFVVQYEVSAPDDDVGYQGGLSICGIYANGMDIKDTLEGESTFAAIEEHCSIAFDDAKRQAKEDEGEWRYQSRRDDEVAA